MPRFILSAPTGLPSNSSGIALNSTHILLTWDAPPQNQTHGDIQEYRVTISEYETGATFNYSTETTELVVGSLHPYYIYNCSVQAVTIDPGPPTVILVRTLEAGTYIHIYDCFAVYLSVAKVNCTLI